MRAVLMMMLGTFLAGCPTNVATCCVRDDGSLFFSQVLQDDIQDLCKGGSVLDPNRTKSGQGEFFDDEEVCGEVCCVKDGEPLGVFASVEACDFEAGGEAFPAEACDGAGKSCRCDDAGVTFTVLTGCGDTPDATEPSFCHSHVEFNLESDPETTELPSGSLLAFPGCEVRMTCP